MVTNGKANYSSMNRTLKYQEESENKNLINIELSSLIRFKCFIKLFEATSRFELENLGFIVLSFLFFCFIYFNRMFFVVSLELYAWGRFLLVIFTLFLFGIR